MDAPAGGLEGEESSAAKDTTSPKRGAFPSPREVLESATPFEPRPEPANETGSQSYSADRSGRLDPEVGETIVSDTQADMGTPGTPPPPPSSAGTGQQADPGNVQSTAGMGTPGTPPPPPSEKASSSQSGDGSTKGTPGTPPPPPSSAQLASAGGMGTAGTPPPPSNSPAASSPSGAGNGMGTAGTPPPPSGAVH